MLGIEIRKRNETRQRSCPWEAYSLSGMMNIGMTRINDNARWHVLQIIGADNKLHGNSKEQVSCQGWGNQGEAQGWGRGLNCLECRAGLGSRGMRTVVGEVLRQA